MSQMHLTVEIDRDSFGDVEADIPDPDAYLDDAIENFCQELETTLKATFPDATVNVWPVRSRVSSRYYCDNVLDLHESARIEVEMQRIADSIWSSGAFWPELPV